MAGLKTLNKKVINDVPFGCYLWEMPDGKGFISDGSGHYFMIFAKAGDLKAIEQLREAVKVDFGIKEGKAVFISGHRPVDDEEYATQKARLKLGLQPDENDLGEVWEDMKKNGRR